MAKVTGIGGVFFKCKDRDALAAWYRDKLGFDIEDGGSVVFRWKDDPKQDGEQYTVWGPFKADTEYFNPSERPFMINLRVDDLDELLSQLKDKGVGQIGEIEDYEQGRFAWIMDPEGTKIELWQPLDG